MEEEIVVSSSSKVCINVYKPVLLVLYSCSSTCDRGFTFLILLLYIIFPKGGGGGGGGIMSLIYGELA